MTTTRAGSLGTHMIVLPGGGYAAHTPHQAEPVARWLGEIGVSASVFRYPLNVRIRCRWTRCAPRSVAGGPQVRSASGLSGSPREVTWPGWPP